jgi:hypothetical protein
MLYAVAAVGDPIGLDVAVAEDRAAAEALAAADHSFVEVEADERHSCRRYSTRGADRERWSVGCSFDGLAAVQLVRLGRPDLATWDDRATPAGVLLRWALDARSRAIGAHMRGDDLVALHSLNVAARASGGGYAMQAEPAGSGFPSADFEIVDQLLADQLRRMSTPRPDVAALLAMGPTLAQAAALVAALDEMRPRQGGQPGGMMYEVDPIFRALTRNEHALPLLIDAVEQDDRLTRGVHAWRDFASGREAIPARDGATFAAMELLGVDVLWPNAGYRSPREIAARLRALFRQAPTAAERHLSTLRNPRAGVEAWALAAEKLDEPLDSMDGHSFPERWDPAEKRRVSRRGDRLRQRRERILTRLLATRLRGAARERDRNSEACVIAEAFVGWATGPEPTLRDLHERCTDPSVQCSCFAGLTVALTELGDRDALQRYATAIRRLHLESTLPDYVFEPLVRYRADPEMQALANWFAERLPHRDQIVLRLARWDLMVVPAFARVAREELRDRRSVATLTTRSHAYQLHHHAAGVRHLVETNDPELPSPDSELDIRRCDRFAASLADREVPFELYWPEARRDAAIAAIRARLPAP